MKAPDSKRRFDRAGGTQLRNVDGSHPSWHKMITNDSKSFRKAVPYYVNDETWRR